MRGLEQEYSPFVAFLWCLFTIGFFVLLVVMMPPIIVAAAYTAMSIVIYRVCHSTFTYMNKPGLSDFNNFVAAFMCAAMWPLYFFFGACMFLSKLIKQE